MKLQDVEQISWQVYSRFVNIAVIIKIRFWWQEIQRMTDRCWSIFPQQEYAFSKESSKYAGCGILKRNFYTRFIPEK